MLYIETTRRSKTPSSITPRQILGQPILSLENARFES
jgi:hypothetical protein